MVDYIINIIPTGVAIQPGGTVKIVKIIDQYEVLVEDTREHVYKNWPKQPYAKVIKHEYKKN